jgi:hypothetical protein
MNTESKLQLQMKLQHMSCTSITSILLVSSNKFKHTCITKFLHQVLQNAIKRSGQIILLLITQADIIWINYSFYVYTILSLYFSYESHIMQRTVQYK